MNDPFKKYRHRFRRWRNTRRLLRERLRYHDLFVKRDLVVPSETEIQQLCRQRLPNLQPKRKGGLRILAVFHHYNWEKDALLPPLEKFGTVRHYDWANEFDHQARGWHDGPKQAMNETLLRRVRDWKESEGVDVIFCYLSGEQVFPDTVRAMAAFGVPMVNLALNDKESFVGPSRGGSVIGARDICRHFHLCWTSTEDALEKYCVEGGVPILLPEGADPSVHHPYDVDRSFDVSFVGQRYGNRPQIIERLQSAGIAVEAFGYGWPNGPLSTDEMVRMYSRSKINLGFGGVDGLDETYCLKGRDFEIPMSGGLYLTEYHSELERCFRLGEEIVTYRNFDELVAVIRDLLANPVKADAIRQRGYQRALVEHTWEMRFGKVFRLLGVLED
ncbi:MAG: glycosyltransferase [Desulfobulbaceae bacterium]|nr:glycosyltransferase [Desulfobulbaceae bacterium]